MNKGTVDYDGEFEPASTTGAGIDVDAAVRQAVALEYIAFHIGKIDKKLDRLIAASERTWVEIAKTKR